MISPVAWPKVQKAELTLTMHAHGCIDDSAAGATLQAKLLDVCMCT